MQARAVRYVSKPRELGRIALGGDRVAAALEFVARDRRAAAPAQETERAAFGLAQDPSTMPAMIIASSGAKNANKAKTKHHKEKYADDGEVRGRRRFVRARGGARLLAGGRLARPRSVGRARPLAR